MGASVAWRDALAHPPVVVGGPPGGGPDRATVRLPALVGFHTTSVRRPTIGDGQRGAVSA